MWMRSWAVAVLGAAVMVAGSAVAAAGAGATDGSKITVRISDPTPRSGETFVLRGRYTLDGSGAAGHTVKVQAFRNGRYVTIDGARVHTDANGHYRVRLILSARGVRDLRVVGVAGHRQANSYHRFVVEVQRAR